MTKREIKDKQIAEKVESLRWQMAAIQLAGSAETSEVDKKQFLDCLAQIIQLEREDAAREGIVEALKDEEEVPQ